MKHTSISISLSPEMAKAVTGYVKEGKHPSVSAFFRHLLQWWEEKQGKIHRK